MSSETEVSIVIPVYNAEKYLERCIESILEQTYKMFEIILVDDGSNDGSELICDDYESKFSNIKAVHQKNAGPSVARNEGIKLANGKYILFVDSDDFLNENCLEYLYSKMKKNDLDMIIANFYTYPEKKKSAHGYTIGKIMTGKEMIDTNLTIHTSNDLCFSVRMLYSMKIIKENKLFFDENIKYGEDTIFNLQCLVQSQRVLAIEDAFYYYDISNNNSAMTAPYKKDYEKSILEQYKFRKNQYGFLQAYDKDMYKYYLEYIIYQMIENCKQSRDGLSLSDLKRINEYPMFIDGRKYFGVFYKTYSIKGYIVYLLMMLKRYRILLRLFAK